jgi:hypothetical protein
MTIKLPDEIRRQVDMSDLLTSIDKAVQETQLDETPQTDSLLKELRRKDGGTKRNWPDNLLVDGHPVKIFDVDAIVQNIVLSAGRDGVVTKEEISKLRELQGRMDDIIAKAEQCSLSKVSDYLHSCRDKIAENIASGNPLPESITPSREAVSRDFLSRQSAYNGALLKLTHNELAQLAGPILARFNSALENLLRETECGDLFICESYGLEYHPSLLWKAFALIAQRYSAKTRLPNPASWITPKTLLQGIVQL